MIRHFVAITELFNTADDALFNRILKNSDHAMQPYLPERSQSYIVTGVPRVLHGGDSRGGGRARGLGPPVKSRGKGPVGGLWDLVPQKLKQNVKLAYNF